VRSLTTSLKFSSKQEQTLHYTSNETNLFSTEDAQSSNKANSTFFMRHPVYLFRQWGGT